MSKKNPMTAAEFMAELEADEGFQSRQKAKEKKLEKRIEADRIKFAPCIERLTAVGFNAQSVEEIVELYSPLPFTAVDILLEFLPSLKDPRHIESVVRALAASDYPFDGRQLAKCFDTTNDEALKWAIVNTIAISHPHLIDGWIVKLCENDYWRKTLYDLGYSD